MVGIRRLGWLQTAPTFIIAATSPARLTLSEENPIVPQASGTRARALRDAAHGLSGRAVAERARERRGSGRRREPRRADSRRESGREPRESDGPGESGESRRESGGKPVNGRVSLSAVVR